MFDNFHASKVLEFPRHGLAALLEMYCDFSADKRYQLADWRIRYASQSDRASSYLTPPRRPVPTEMVK